MLKNNYQFTLDEPAAVIRARCAAAIEALGWHISPDASEEYRLSVYVPDPALLSRAPVYSINLHPDGDMTYVALVAANDDLSQTRSRTDLPRLMSAIISGAGAIPEAEVGKCFISYRRFDSADVVGRIYDRLIAAYDPATIFKDVDNIPLGTDFRQVIDQAVSQCGVLLAVIGRDWLTVTDEMGRRRLDSPQDFVRIEIETALKHQIPVVPVLVRGAVMPAEDELPPSFAPIVYQHGAQVRPDPDFHHDMDRLIASLSELLGA